MDGDDAVSDGGGRFSIGGLTPGVYDLIVSAEGHLRGIQGWIELGDHEQVRAIALQPAGSLSGRVMGANGLPVEHVLVRASESDDLVTLPREPDCGCLGCGPRLFAITDAAGKFHVDDITGHSVSLAVAFPGFAMWASARVEVDGTEHVIVLQPGGAIRGRVTEAGKPAAARVSMPGDQTITGPDGRFRFDHVPPGNVALVVTGTRGASHRRLSVAVNAGSEASVEIELQQAESMLATSDVELPPRPEEESCGIAPGLAGVLRDADGRPASFAVLELTSATGASASGMSDARGRFAFAGACPGPAELEAILTPSEAAATTLVDVTRTGTPIEIAMAPAVELHVTAAGAPAIGAIVWAKPLSSNRPIPKSDPGIGTDQRGIALVPVFPGRIRFTIEHGGNVRQVVATIDSVEPTVIDVAFP